MIEGAAVFGRLRDEGGEVVGWWPTTSDDVDTAGRHVRLYHKTFDPLTKGEADGLGGGWLEHGLPAVLHTFRTHCSLFENVRRLSLPTIKSQKAHDGSHRRSPLLYALRARGHVGTLGA